MEILQEAMLECNRTMSGFENRLQTSFTQRSGGMADDHMTSSLMKLEPSEEKHDYDIFSNPSENPHLVSLDRTFEGEDSLLVQPESPFSVQSSSSHGSFLAFRADACLSDSSPQKQPSQPLPGNALPEAILLQPSHTDNPLFMEEETTSLSHRVSSLEDFTQMQLQQQETGFTFSDSAGFWALPHASAHHTHIPVSPLSSVSSTASEAARLFLNPIDYASLAAMPLMYADPVGTAFQLDESGNGLDNTPRDQHTSESIFDEFNFPGLTAHLDETTPPPARNSEAQPMHDYGHGLASHFGPSSVPRAQDFSENVAPLERKMGLARRAKTAAAKRTKADPDGGDYVPHTKRKRPAGNKAKRAAISARQAAALDEAEGKHEAKRTAVTTARGRTVNRLQLTEEDNSDDCLEGNNRRCKHHNPWSVEETEALVSGVQTCGGGKWAEIKKLGLRAIEKRSAVDLKDKWRNLQAALNRPKGDKKREIPAGLLQRVRLLVPLTATKARTEARPNIARSQGRLRERSRRSAAALE